MSSEPSAEGEAPWLRLNPLGPVVVFLPACLTVLWHLAPLLIVSALGLHRNDSEGGVGFFAAVLGFGALLVVLECISTRFVTYRFAGSQLEIRSGIFSKRHRIIEADRVQNTAVLTPLMHRVFGLVHLRVETANNRDGVGELSAVSPAAAQAVVEAISLARSRAPSTAPAAFDEEQVAHAGPRELLRYGSTSFGFGLLLLFLLRFREQFQFVEDEAMEWVRAHWPAGTLTWERKVFAVVALLLAMWLANIAAAIVRFGGFRLVHRAEHFTAVGGLFTRSRVDVPLPRIQRLVFIEPLLRRWLGFGSLEIDTAASAKRSAEDSQKAEVFVPVVEHAALAALVARAMPELSGSILLLPLRPAPRKALYRVWLRTSVIGAAIGTAATLRWGALGAVAFAYWPIALVGAWFDWRFQGFWHSPQLLVTRSGFWTRSTTVVRRSRIQSAKASQGPLERSWGLGHLTVSVAGSHVALPSLDWAEAQALRDELPSRWARRSRPSPAPA